MNPDSTLRSIFQQAFDYRTYCDKIANGIFGCNNLKTTPELLETTNEGDRSHHMGSMEDADGRLLGFFYTRVADGADVRRRRVGLRKLIAPYLKYDVDAAIVVFDDGQRWRLSYICDLREGATAARRFSYVLGDEHGQYRTPIAQLQKLQGKHLTLSDLHEAFSVEALSKEFYNELFGWFEWAISTEGGVYFPNSTATADDDFEDIEKKIIRLITRLMFIWFIKQKDLVPARLFDAQFVGSVLKNFDPQSRTTGEYYNAILQNLFFATLNRAIRDENGNGRAFARLQGQRDIKTLYRYKEMFSIGEQQVVELFAQIPFLNGGLFECLDKTKQIDGVEKAYNHDGFSRKDSRDKTTGRYKHRAMVPNRLFFDTERGLFAVLNRYNFTIEENAPNDLQVALDPEMLGKVFENLLGYYNPETRETARNQSGSFYTPRPIVNYMVDESLKAYLGNTPLVNDIFRDDFQADELRWRDYQRIAGQLRSLTVFDPACGSGAFPMGLLNRIVELLQRLDPENNSTNGSYKFKLHLIEHCLYGCDIQSIAAQITKLRFFISLVCDCERDNSKPNFGIPTLPNLETKFVTANSLIGLTRQPGNILFLDTESKKTELRRVRHQHFNARTASEKIKLRNLDAQLRNEL
ncbi:MAG: restriction endonuclease, partial [Bacteroidales bacterium]|nr:restriction endonuclease [Bacteroidales bacterium]